MILDLHGFGNQLAEGALMTLKLSLAAVAGGLADRYRAPANRRIAAVAIAAYQRTFGQVRKEFMHKISCDFMERAYL